MKLAIATPEQVGETWRPFLTDFICPGEIRARLERIYENERIAQENGTLGPNTEVRIVTMNRTVLDAVTSEDAKYVGHMTYEDVFVWREDQGRLVPLLDLHSADRLCHFSLGDLFERGLL